jgi:hypothetical protein
MPVTIVDAARAIRAYLPDLIPDTAQEIDDQLAAVLSPTVSTDQERRIRALLSSRAETSEWAAAFLELGMPPEIYPYQERGWAPEGMVGVLSTGPRPIAGKRFKCPEEDFDFYRPSVGDPLPLCITHHRDLVPADS